MENNLSEMNVDLVRTVTDQEKEIESLKFQLTEFKERENERYKKLINLNKASLESSQKQQILTSDIISTMKPMGTSIDELKREVFAKYDRSTAHAECNIHDNLDLYHNIAYHIITICEKAMNYLSTGFAILIFLFGAGCLVSTFAFDHIIPGYNIVMMALLAIEVMFIIASTFMHKYNYKLMCEIEKYIVVDQMIRSKDFVTLTKDDITITRAAETGVLFYRVEPNEEEEELNKESEDYEDGRE